MTNDEQENGEELSELQPEDFEVENYEFEEDVFQIEGDEGDIFLQKFNLQEGDVLVVKVDISGLDEQQATEKLAKIKNDEVLSYLNECGKKILITYTGIDMSILRMDPTDKLIVYSDVSSFEDEEDKNKYVDLIRQKITGQVTGNEVVILPIDRAALSAFVHKQGDENGSEGN